MCGIGGVKRMVGERAIEKDMIDILLCSLEERGNDATGVALVSEDNQIFVHKDNEPAWRFVSDTDYTSFMKEHLTPAIHTVLVHTRLATTGTPLVNANNHPLFHKKCAVVHNGIISNHEWLFKELNLERAADTDSDILRAIIETNGFTPKAYRKLARISGSVAAAIIHVDHPKHLLLLRSGSPLVTAADNEFLYFASELKNIQTATKQWERRFGLWLQRKSPDIAFAPMATDTAWLIGPNGLVWHQEYKTAAYQGITTRGCSNTYEAHAARQERWKAASKVIKMSANSNYAELTEDAKDIAPTHLECPKCRRILSIPDEYIGKPYENLRCKECDVYLGGAKRYIKV